jgi:hypothetical protein
MDVDVVRHLIRRRLEDGRLTRNPTIELGYGQGIGQDCDGCGETIATDQKMTARICADDWRTLRLHDRCCSDLGRRETEGLAAQPRVNPSQEIAGAVASRLFEPP